MEAGVHPSTQQVPEEDKTTQVSIQGSLAQGARAAPRARVAPDAVAASLGSGRHIDPAVRRGMEAFFGHDFRRVRVHDDAHTAAVATSLHARAFTVGEHIGFAAGAYRPDAPEGTRLLVHELTHVVQQSRGLRSNVLHAGIGSPGDDYEQDAERSAERHASGQLQVNDPARGTRPLRISRSDALQLYSGTAAATYARTWAKSTNPSYPRFYNDCTNFVSQATEAGGWAMTSGGCWSRKDNDVWWYGESRCWYPTVRASYTWAGAHNFSNFVTTSGRGTLAKAVADLDVGDVLQIAFTGTQIGHSMVVTDKKGGDVYLSYHTSDHVDEPFFAAGGIYSRYPSATYYGWKL